MISISKAELLPLFWNIIMQAFFLTRHFSDEGNVENEFVSTLQK